MEVFSCRRAQEYAAVYQECPGVEYLPALSVASQVLPEVPPPPEGKDQLDEGCGNM